MPVFCLFTLGRHGNFTAGVTMEQPDLLCTALALNIELLSIIVCAVLETSYQNTIYLLKKYCCGLVFTLLYNETCLNQTTPGPTVGQKREVFGLN